MESQYVLGYIGQNYTKQLVTVLYKTTCDSWRQCQGFILDKITLKVYDEHFNNAYKLTPSHKSIRSVRYLPCQEVEWYVFRALSDGPEEVPLQHHFLFPWGLKVNH